RDLDPVLVETLCGPVPDAGHVVPDAGREGRADREVLQGAAGLEVEMQLRCPARPLVSQYGGLAPNGEVALDVRAERRVLDPERERDGIGRAPETGDVGIIVHSIE